MRWAVFLDRDGVVNRSIIEDRKSFSPRAVERFRIYVGIRDVLECLDERGY
jgi:D-glycero-D-manno-heptose 1,7-bisphosphate phosphatase